MKTLIRISAACLVLVSGVSFAQTVAVYPVKTEGFTLNQSEVDEMSRIALQACFDGGLRCKGRGYSLGSVQREQALTGKTSKAAAADYVAEFAVVGKTKDKFNVGLKNDTINVPVFAAKKVGASGSEAQRTWQPQA